LSTLGHMVLHIPDSV